MKTTFAAIFWASFAASLAAQHEVASPPRIHTLLARDVAAAGSFLDADLPRSGGVTYHGGPVIVQARVVFIFWGPTFSELTSSDSTYAHTLQAFRDQFGTSPEYNILTQYYQIVGGVKQYIELTNLAAGTADLFDNSPPPTNVTDADVQAEVKRYLTTHTVDYSTIYEVVLPSTSYSSAGGGNSCGGPNLAYCAYYSWYGSASTAVKYTVQPYASCSGCQVSGWTAAQNEEHFIVHGTGDTVTDPVGTGWYSATGGGVEDQCAWAPPPFLSGGYGYQYQWSNAAAGCVKTR